MNAKVAFILAHNPLRIPHKLQDKVQAQLGIHAPPSSGDSYLMVSPFSTCIPPYEYAFLLLASAYTVLHPPGIPSLIYLPNSTHPSKSGSRPTSPSRTLLIMPPKNEHPLLCLPIGLTVGVSHLACSTP